MTARLLRYIVRKIQTKHRYSAAMQDFTSVVKLIFLVGTVNHSNSAKNTIKPQKVRKLVEICWLFWVYWPFETVFQSSGRFPERGKKRREKIKESKTVQIPPPPLPHPTTTTAPTASE